MKCHVSVTQKQQKQHLSQLMPYLESVHMNVFLSLNFLGHNYLDFD